MLLEALDSSQLVQMVVNERTRKLKLSEAEKVLREYRAAETAKASKLPGYCRPGRPQSTVPPPGPKTSALPKPPSQSPRGRIYPPPTISQTAFAGLSFAVLAPSEPS